MTYTTIEKVSAELNGLLITSDTIPSIDTVTNWITETDAEIDRRAGKTYAQSTYVDIMDIRDGDCGVFRLSTTPVISITSLEYNAENLGDTPVWTEKTEAVDFFMYEDTGEIEATPKWSNIKSGNKRLKVTYEAGHATTPGYITSLASKMVAKKVISAKLNETSSQDGGSISVGSISISDPTNFSISYIKNLNYDINEGFKKLVSGFKVPRYTRY